MALKKLGRSLTLALVGVLLLFGVLGLVRQAGPFHIVRVLVDAAAVLYLMLPEIKKRFAAVLVPAK